MKKYIIVLLLLLFIIPSVSFASWWNPLTWFSSTTEPQIPVSTKVTKKKTPAKKPAVTGTGCAAGNLFSTTTGKPCTGTTTTTTKTTATPTINGVSTNDATNTPTILPPPATGQYSMQDCYNECEYYPTTVSRDLCKHSNSTQSCDMFGRPGSALDDFINRLKANFALKQNASTFTGVYTMQDCYNECEYYPTVTSRDLCKHSNSTQSCDMFGRPGSALDDFINRLKANFALKQGITNNQGQNTTYDTGQ